MKEKKTVPTVRVWLRWGLLMGLLAAAAILGWNKWKPEQAVILPSPAPAPVNTDRRTTRETAYEQDLEALEKLIGQSGDALREQASQKMLQLVEEHQNELALEETLRQAGYEGALVLVQNASVTVLIPSAQMTAENAASIIALCVAHTGVGAENIRIMPLDQRHSSS